MAVESDYRSDWARSGAARNLTQWLYSLYNTLLRERTDGSFVGCLQRGCDYDAWRADSVLKCCEASEGGVIGGTCRGWSEFALTQWDI